MDSAGLSQSSRARLEAQWRQQVKSEVRGFLVEVERMALDAHRAPVVLAAGPPDPFSLGRITDAWGRTVSPAMLARIVLALRFPSPEAALADVFVQQVMRRITSAELPIKAFEAASDTLARSLDNGWTRAQIARELRGALAYDSDDATDWAGHSRRIARTEATAVHGHRQLLDLAEQGYPYKKWVAHHDKRTRPSHAGASGQVAPLDQPFVVGGHPLMAPGDPTAPYGEVASCRCTVVGRRRP